MSHFSTCSRYDAFGDLCRGGTDPARLEHLEYWTGLIGEYQEITGQFPFTCGLASQESIGLVRIEIYDLLSDPGSRRCKGRLT